MRIALRTSARHDPFVHELSKVLPALTLATLVSCVPRDNQRTAVIPPAETRTPAPEQPEKTESLAAPRQPALKGTATVMGLEKFFELQQAGRLLVFDARPSIIHAFGAIPGAINWPRSAFDNELATHEPEIRKARAEGKTVVVYCTDLECPDARAVAERLADLGYDSSVLEGGYAMWKESGLSLE